MRSVCLVAAGEECGMACWWIPLFGGLVTLSACARPFTAAPPPMLTPSPLLCAVSSPVDPQLHVPAAGPLLFYAHAGPETHAIVGDFQAGLPTKVAISARQPLTTPVTLEGWDCTSGQRLRFWYGHPDNPFPSLPVSAAQLVPTGDLVATLQPSGRTGYPGYMLFTHPGRWKVDVFQGQQRSGELVFRVGAAAA